MLKLQVGGTYRWMQWSRIRARGIERAYELHERLRMIPWRRIENKALITADITHPIVYPWCIGRGKVVVDPSKVYVCHKVCRVLQSLGIVQPSEGRLSDDVP